VKSLSRQLVDLLGSDAVSTAPEVLATHSTDRWFASRPPDVVVFAETTDQVSALLRFASRKGIPVTPRGAGVGYVGGCVPMQGGIALSLARMRRIKEIHFEDAVAVVEPGVITGELQAEVRKRGLFYPPDPASLKECSLGGNIATNAGGPRCLKYGVTRNYVLGLEVVLASGDVLRTGGRTHKNKTGSISSGSSSGRKGCSGLSPKRRSACCPCLRRGRRFPRASPPSAKPQMRCRRFSARVFSRLHWRWRIASP
jgi:FAD/FMN-containing dehydrogenase